MRLSFLESLHAIDVCPFKQSQRTFAVMQNLVQIGYKALRNQIALSRMFTSHMQLWRYW